MAELTTLARPYAKAAFEFALSDSNLESWSNMLKLLAAVSQSDSVQALMASPGHTVQQKAGIIIDICGDALSEKGKNFVDALASNKRLALLTEITESFEQLKANQEKMVDVEIVSAHELSEATYANLIQSLTSQLSRELNVISSVDRDLIGGVVIRAGDMIIDGSIKGRLAKLSESFNS